MSRCVVVLSLATLLSGCHDDRCFGRKVPVCLAELPTTHLTITGSGLVLDTDTSPMCSPTDRPEYCVLVGTVIFVEATLRATGRRPLVLLALDTIVVNAPIDVGSHRGQIPEVGAGADPPGCAPGATPPQQRCPGRRGEGEGGHGGGSVLLIAGKWIIAGKRTARIDAQGENGEDGIEPGGGGAGGSIMLDTPRLGSYKGNPLTISSDNGKGGVRLAKRSTL